MSGLRNEGAIVVPAWSEVPEQANVAGPACFRHVTPVGRHHRAAASDRHRVVRGVVERRLERAHHATDLRQIA